MKKGISLVALIITIIVLIILTAAVIWSSGDTPEQTKLAVFYNDVTVIQEAVTTKSLTNYVDLAVEPDGANAEAAKWNEILAGGDPITGTKLNTILGNGVELHQFASGAAAKLGLNSIGDEELAEYVVDSKSGTVYYTNGILVKLNNTDTIVFNRALTVASSDTNYSTAAAGAIPVKSYVKGNNGGQDANLSSTSFYSAE